jgi:DNA-binding transcriptional ArsR family regulator
LIIFNILVTLHPMPRPTRHRATREQREALTSPLRLEILGQFTGPKPLSVRDLAERMGRTPHSIYYHVHLMTRLGLLREVGRREGGGRSEALIQPAVDKVALDAADPEAGLAIRRTMGAAFRMAERDLEAALESAPGDPRLFGMRGHFRATPRVLRQVRRHLEAALEIVQREARRGPGRKPGPLYSLTLALLPLRGRNQPEGDA